MSYFVFTCIMLIFLFVVMKNVNKNLQYVFYKSVLGILLQVMNEQLGGEKNAFLSNLDVSRNQH